jgi:hypothetical protein
MSSSICSSRTLLDSEKREESMIENRVVPAELVFMVVCLMIRYERNDARWFKGGKLRVPRRGAMLGNIDSSLKSKVDDREEVREKRQGNRLQRQLYENMITLLVVLVLVVLLGDVLNVKSKGMVTSTLWDESKRREALWTANGILTSYRAWIDLVKNSLPCGLAPLSNQ